MFVGHDTEIGDTRTSDIVCPPEKGIEYFLEPIQELTILVVDD